MKINGLVLGKFYPFHNGHKYLIEEALKRCDHLTVLVCSLKKETIDGNLRFKWVQETFPSVNVIHVTDENPQYPEEHPNFWEIWKSTIQKAHPEPIHILFTSEYYGNPLSQVLSCRHECIDLERKNFPISGSLIREKPFLNWDFLPKNVKPYFTKKIVITGSESTGKTTLCEKLAEYFQTEWVPEYARILLESKNRHVIYDDIEEIRKGHLELEDKKLQFANKYLFIDTDMIITKLYSLIYFQKVPDSVLDSIIQRKYDLHIVLAPDVPWVEDPQRDLP
ncbi:MAG: AAA family ATPase, partial [Leptospiraceae bacterium]|nr:AAA family ATPase [Leptospiraceae bacterium]